MMSTGTFDAAGKVLTSKALMDDLSTGKPIRVTEKLTVVSSDELLMEMWGPAPDGKDFRMMELRYTRKK